MFKKSALILGRCTHGCLRSGCIRWHHSAKFKAPLAADAKNSNGYLKALANFKTKGIFLDQSSHHDGRPTPKTLEDGSVGVIHVQENESANLANPMQRRFLHDLEFQQAQRIEENRVLKEEKKDNQEDLGSLTKEITCMAAKGAKKGGKKGGKGKKKKAKKDPCKKKDACKKKPKSKKKKKAGASKKCKELAQKEKCRKLAKAAKKKKMMKKCKELVQKEKCRKMAKKAKSKKGKGKKK